MKTKTIELYEYSELSDKAKEKARDKWNETNDDPLLQSHMINLLTEKLDDRGIKHWDMDVRYSLSHSQGDGFMFIGKVIWRDVELTIIHMDSHYFHEKTAEFDAGGALTYQELGQFQAVYEAICKEMERVGYDEIEYRQSEEVFEQECDGNGYTFREDGTMENE